MGIEPLEKQRGPFAPPQSSAGDAGLLNRAPITTAGVLGCGLRFKSGRKPAVVDVSMAGMPQDGFGGFTDAEAGHGG